MHLHLLVQCREASRKEHQVSQPGRPHVLPAADGLAAKTEEVAGSSAAGGGGKVPKGKGEGGGSESDDRTAVVGLRALGGRGRCVAGAAVVASTNALDEP